MAKQLFDSGFEFPCFDLLNLNNIIRALTREGLANAMSDLNGGMTVTGEEIDAMMQHATAHEYVSCSLSPSFSDISRAHLPLWCLLVLCVAPI